MFRLWRDTQVAVFWLPLLHAALDGLPTMPCEDGNSERDSRFSGHSAAASTRTQDLDLSRAASRTGTFVNSAFSPEKPGAREAPKRPDAPDDAPPAALPSVFSRESRAVGFKEGDEDEVPVQPQETPKAPATVDILLPLDHRLLDVLNFYRLMADIAMTYLRLLSSTQHKEKVTSLAARYCLLTITHTQVLLHCFTLWKGEKLGDDGGFVDYEQQRNLDFTNEAGAEATMDSDADTQSGKTSRGRRQRDSRIVAILGTLALAEAHCRYYYVSLLTSYSLLLVGVLVGKSDRVQNRIYGNALEHLEAACKSARSIGSEYPREYLGRLLLAMVPDSSPDNTLWANSSSHGSGSSRLSTHRGLSLSTDPYRHTYLCGAPWSPLHSGLVALSQLRHVRMCVQEDVNRRSLVVPLTPASRMSDYYLTWKLKSILNLVPGRNGYMLTRSLPGFVPGKATLLHDSEMPGPVPEGLAGVEEDGSKEGEAAISSPVAQGSFASLPQTSELAFAAPPMRRQRLPQRFDPTSKQKAFVKSCRETVGRRGRKVNTDLRPSDPRTCVALCLDEASATTMVALFAGVQLSATVGQLGTAAHYGAALLSLAAGIFGPQSAEFYIIRYRLGSGDME